MHTSIPQNHFLEYFVSGLAYHGMLLMEEKGHFLSSDSRNVEQYRLIGVVIADHLTTNISLQMHVYGHNLAKHTCMICI